MGVAACRLFAYNRWMFESGKSSDKGGGGEWHWWNTYFMASDSQTEPKNPDATK